MRAIAQSIQAADAANQEPEVATKSRKEKLRRLSVIIGTIILAIFLVYLLLILVYPSMNIGVNP